MCELKVMAKVIMSDLIIGKCNHYEKRNLWQVLLMAKEIMASVLMPIVIMAIVIMAMYLWQKYHDKCY